MSSLYCKLIPLFISCILFILAFRVHERFWSLGFLGWPKIYLGLAALFLGSLAGVFFEFAELRRWQEILGLPIDWLVLSLFASLGAALILWGAVERLSRAAREKDDLEKRKEAFELFDGIRDAAEGPYSFLEILNFSLKEIMRKVDADAGGIWLRHPSSSDFILAAASGFPLSLQQRLEKVPAAHAGFSRLVDGRTAREMADPASLRHFFPELFSADNGYGSLLGVPLLGGHGRAQHREPLGLLLFCARGKRFLYPADMRLIGSAVAFLAATVAGVRASRLLRNERRAGDRWRAGEREFSIWVQAWGTEKGARRRLQVAVTRLAERAGDFVGCGRYLSKENRWEPLALAATVADEHPIGKEGFRSAAAQAVQTGKEIMYELPAGERREGKASGYRMVPVANPAAPEGYSAVLFLPVMHDAPSWWAQAISNLAELTRVVLAVEDAKTEKSIRASLPRSGPALNWPGLGQLLERGLRGRPEELPGLLAGVLPDGRRMALWQSVPGNRSEYRLRLAAAVGEKGVYYSAEELASAPAADQVEVNAHLGGLVRLNYKSAGALTGLWPDFGSGWRAERLGAPFAPKSWGWVTFYQKVGSAEADEQEMDFLKCLAGLMELVISRLDEASTDRGRQKAAGEAQAASQDKTDTGAKEQVGEPLSDSRTDAAPNDGEQNGLHAAENVLIVDEEELIRDLLLGMLNVLGYQATATTSTEEGLKRFFAGDFDTIITGLGVSGPSADGLAERVKLHRPQTRIVLVTEVGLEGSAEPSSRWIDATLTKPFRIDELRVILEADSG